MEFLLRAGGSVSRLGILAGTFNPITVAHIALGRAALPLVDEVVFVIPRVLPHKKFTGASFEQRVEMLQAAVRGQPGFSAAAVNGGLFVEIADECRAEYGDGVQLTFLCGRDAAERVTGWDYGSPFATAGMLRRFDLLVAARGGGYTAPAEWGAAVRPLDLKGDFNHISATEVRKRISAGEPWEKLVPEGAVELIQRIYCPEFTRIYKNSRE